MNPFDKFVDKEEKADAAKEASCFLHIKLLQEQFAHAAHQKVNGLLMDTSHSEDGTDVPDFGDNGIHGTEDDNEDKDFSYHLLDGLAEEEVDDHGELGVDAVGTSPLVTSAGGKVRKMDDLPNWFKEITQNQTYDKNNLLAALVNQIFPCIACSDHKNFQSSST